MLYFIARIVGAILIIFVPAKSYSNDFSIIDLIRLGIFNLSTMVHFTTISILAYNWY